MSHDMEMLYRLMMAVATCCYWYDMHSKPAINEDLEESQLTLLQVDTAR